MRLKNILRGPGPRATADCKNGSGLEHFWVRRDFANPTSPLDDGDETVG
jgi:hypothetical protein